MAENIFAEDWVDCLKAHYRHVIRIHDTVTEPSLTIVMHSAGFSDAQLAELRVRATMHVDDAGADFVPDLDVLDGHDASHTAAETPEAPVFNIPIDVPAPLEQPPVQTVESLETELNPTEAELEPDADDPEDAEVPQPPDRDAPQQLSLF